MASIGIGGSVDTRAFVGMQTNDGLTPARFTSVGGHVVCSAGLAPRLSGLRIRQPAAKGFDRCASCDDTADFAVVAFRAATRALWVVAS
jgi:hypothetical protein